MYGRRNSPRAPALNLLGVLAPIFSLVTCSSPAPAELAEVCGAAGPIRVLELRPDERLVPVFFGGIRQVGERLIVLAGTGEGEPVFGLPSPASIRIHSVGLCGEDPVILGDDISSVWSSTLWPDLLLGLREGTKDLLVLDPSGAHAPRLLIPGGHGIRETKHGFVVTEKLDETLARVFFYPTPADPFDADAITPIVLLDPIQRFSLATDLKILQHELFAFDLDGSVVRVSLPAGDVTIEQRDTLGFRVSGDGRYLVWQDAFTTDEDGSDHPPGDLMLRDLQEGSESFLAHASIDSQPHFHGEFLQLSRGEGQGHLIVELATRETFDLAPGRELFTTLDGGRLLLSSTLAGGPWYLLDPHTGDEVQLTWKTSRKGGPSADALYLFHGNELSDLKKPASLWRYPFDLSPPEQLATETSLFVLILRDERIVTVLDLDDSWSGNLVLVDPDTLEERPIDNHVHALTALRGDTPALDTLVYARSEGARSGVWRARLAPRE